LPSIICQSRSFNALLYCAIAVLPTSNCVRSRDTPIVVVSGNPGRGRDDLRSSTLNALDWLSNPACAAQVQAALTRSRASIDSLIAILRKPMAFSSPPAPEQVPTERQSA
jgi:hypothetical protein